MDPGRNSYPILAWLGLRDTLVPTLALTVPSPEVLFTLSEEPASRIKGYSSALSCCDLLRMESLSIPKSTLRRMQRRHHPLPRKVCGGSGNELHLLRVIQLEFDGCPDVLMGHLWCPWVPWNPVWKPLAIHSPSGLPRVCHGQSSKWYDPDEVQQQTGCQLGLCGQMLLPKSSTCWFSRRPAEVGHKGLALWGDGQRLQVSLGQQLGENFPLGHPQGGLAPGATTGSHRLRPCCPCGMDPMSPRAWHCLLME